MIDGNRLAVLDSDAQTMAVVLILLRLRSVSPQPPSAFWFLASQDAPALTQDADVAAPWCPFVSATSSASTAVPVERALLARSPSQ